MRLFIAVPLPVLWMEWLTENQRRLRHALPQDRSSLRWTPTDQWHITLQFLGECAESKLAGIQSAIQDSTASFSAFRASLGERGTFGGPRGGTLWVGLKTGHDELRALAQHLGEGLARQGYVLEKRPFHGHVTLARSRSKISGKSLAELAPSQTPCPDSYLDQIVLFHSILGSTGARYEAISRHKLGI